MSDPLARISQVVRGMVEGALQPSAIVDRELRVLLYNRAYAQLASIRGRRGGELREICHERFGLSTCQEPEGCLARRAFETRKPLRHENVAGRDEMHFNIAAVPLLDPNGVPFAVVESLLDVSAEARMQRSYRDLLDRERARSETLQQEVDVRTAELRKSLVELREARTQLVQSEKLSALGLLVAGIAHEINTPLNAVYANLDFVDEAIKGVLGLATPGPALEAAQADLAHLLGTMREGAERVARLVRDLRVYTHGGTNTGLEPYEINSAVELTVRLVKPQARDRVSFQLSLEATGTVHGHGPHVNQVLLNLMNNAIQAIPGPGTVWVRTRGDEQRISVEVEDSGTGVPPEIVEKIFDPFFTTKPVGEGTGLGLSIASRLVEEQGGKLTVESPPGKGACFRFSLPRDPRGQAGVKR